MSLPPFLQSDGALNLERESDRSDVLADCDYKVDNCALAFMLKNIEVMRET
jgi:hypothetical protein